MRKKLLVGTSILLALLATGCSKKDTQPAPKTPSATSLIVKNKVASNGHYQIKLKASNKQTTKLTGKYKLQAPIYLNYQITNKKQKRWEKMWLTKNKQYLLLKGNHGHWLKMKKTYNNFDPSQVTKRFNPQTLNALNKVVAHKARVKRVQGVYNVTYQGNDNAVWQKLNPLVISTLNAPGTQNMNVNRVLNSIKPSMMQIRYIVSGNKIQDVYYTAKFSLNNNLSFTWTSHYDELGEHNKLKVPNKIKTNAIDINSVKTR